MGELADTVLADDGKVIGIIPQALVDKEVSHNGLTELMIVNSMHERKALMADFSDGFSALKSKSKPAPINSDSVASRSSPRSYCIANKTSLNTTMSC